MIKWSVLNIYCYSYFLELSANCPFFGREEKSQGAAFWLAPASRWIHVRARTILSKTGYARELRELTERL